MATQYASLQPSKSNRLKSIAIVGASGNVGSHIVSALLERGECNVTAISRADSKASFPKDVKVARVDYEKPDTLVAALKGHDALIITMSVFAAPGAQAKLIRAAAAAGVTWIMPNEFGMYNTDEAQNDTIGPGKAEDRALIESLNLSWTGLTCGFWYEHSLCGPGLFGINIAKREMEFFDEGMQEINTSTWPLVGRAVAEILSLPILPWDERDKSLTLWHYHNAMAYVSSFTVSQRDMFESVKHETNTTDDDWDVFSTPAEERYTKAKRAMKGGNRTAFAKVLYTRYFFPGEDAGLFEKGHGLDNELLGLPKQNLDAATKEAIKLGESGYWSKYGQRG
ncbi:hypothetical protein BKA63DRAFT_72838 [Paraphoma chrysanthemicola]|nr:hypothetical protein BKA63DRAFT_72838 [Paraphoma chrysanthemicola]